MVKTIVSHNRHYYIIKLPVGMHKAITLWKIEYAKNMSEIVDKIFLTMTSPDKICNLFKTYQPPSEHEPKKLLRVNLLHDHYKRINIISSITRHNHKKILFTAIAHYLEDNGIYLYSQQLKDKLSKVIRKYTGLSVPIDNIPSSTNIEKLHIQDERGQNNE